LPAGKVLYRAKRYVRVQMTADELAELLSDAQHYATEDAFGDPWMFGLIYSARATVKILQAAG
jgi:hypothetical protein